MTYQAKPSPQAMEGILADAQPLWAVRRMAGHSTQKEMLIKQAIWPRIFHASGILHATEGHIGKLRTCVVRALGHGKAGASPLIRLGYGRQPLLDPGLFRVWSIFRDFRRLANKQPMLVQLWEAFHLHHSGKPMPGPCSILMQQFQVLGWYVLQPPHCLDHDGLQFDFQQESVATLWQRTLDAWYQSVASRICVRTTLTKLQGVKLAASKYKEDRLMPLQQAQIAALREGAFLTARHFKHYDVQQDQCPGLRYVRQHHVEAVQRWSELPECITHHLLAPRNPWMGALRRAFDAIATPESFLEELPYVQSTVDLFSDGSCTSPAYSPLSLAGWGVVSATHGQLLASGPLRGWEQCNARAERTAALVALIWSLRRTHKTVLWTDPAHVATHFWRLQALSWAELPNSHGDLWQEVRDSLSVSNGGFKVIHVPAHQQHDTNLAEADIWAIHWNSKADIAAAEGRQRRLAPFWTLWAQYRDYEQQTLRDVGLLRQLHLAVAAANPTLHHTDWMEAELSEEDESVWEPRLSDQEPWISFLPDTWTEQLDTTPALEKWCVPFLQKLLAWQISHSSDGTACCEVSWLELVFILHANGIAELPHPIASHNGAAWVLSCDAPQESHVSCTVAGLIRYLKGALFACGEPFGCPINEVKGLCLGACGISFPLQGLPLVIPPMELKTTARQAIQLFTLRRPVRVANDLSRPIR